MLREVKYGGESPRRDEANQLGRVLKGVSLVTQILKKKSGIKEEKHKRVE